MTLRQLRLVLLAVILLTSGCRSPLPVAGGENERIAGLARLVEERLCYRDRLQEEVTELASGLNKVLTDARRNRAREAYEQVYTPKMHALDLERQYRSLEREIRALQAQLQVLESLLRFESGCKE